MMRRLVTGRRSDTVVASCHSATNRVAGRLGDKTEVLGTGLELLLLPPRANLDDVIKTCRRVIAGPVGTLLC